MPFKSLLYYSALELLDIVLNRRREKEELNRKSAMKSSQTQKLGSFRLGIAGPPGAGKSTFIEALGMHLVKEVSDNVPIFLLSSEFTYRYSVIRRSLF